MWFTPLLQGAAAGVIISRPNSDVSVTGWTSSDAQPLYSDIDEVTANDVDYIYSPTLSGSLTSAVFGLSLSIPSGTHSIRIRAQRTAATGDVRVLLLDSSGTTVGTSSWQTLTAAFANYILSVTTTGTAARISIEVRP